MQLTKIQSKKTTLFFLLLLTASFGFAQDFTWVSGSNTFNQASVFGTLGAPATGNIPGARLSSVSWKDSNGNFWLFGGAQPSSNLSYLDLLNDLWKYDVATNQWTWIKGSSSVNQYGNSAGLGIPSLNNTPGARMSATGWTDASGNFWLYGGVGNSISGYGELGDLWTYNVTSNEWTCVSGSNNLSQNSVYGTLGVSAAGNGPGSRRAAAVWTDSQGNAWMLGGLGMDDVGVYGPLNDLWKYNMANGLWTWMSGSSSGNQNGSYGTMGVAAASNMPGGRYSCATSLDGSGNLLVFGGVGYDVSSSGQLPLNDVWTYNMAANKWTWIKGGTGNSQLGTYGTLGVAAPGNTPGGRSVSCFWTSLSGKLMVFGGHGFGATPGNELNDLWEYDNNTNEWTWIKGSNTNGQVGTYGTQGVAAPANVPGNRSCGIQWIDNSGNLWLFGGYTPTVNFSIYNDLWKFGTCTTTPPTLTAAMPPATCAGQQATLTASGAVYYTWNGVSTGTASSLILLPTTTSSFVIVGSDMNACSVGMASVTLIVNALPNLTLTSASTSVCAGQPVALTASGASSYTWGPGITGNPVTLFPTLTTTYTVIGTDANGCMNKDSITQIVNALPSLTLASASASVCAGQPAALSVSGASSYTWVSGIASNTVTFFPNSTTTYSVAGTDANGCINTDSIIQLVNALPSLILSSASASICKGAPATLSVSGASSYTWGSGVTGNTVTFFPNSTTTYSVTGKDVNGCVSTATLTQHVSICTGIDVVSEPDLQISVYPNPTHGSFSIQLEQEALSEMIIYDTRGVTVFSLKTAGKTLNIDFTEQANGLYFIEVRQGDHLMRCKIVKL